MCTREIGFTLRTPSLHGGEWLWTIYDSHWLALSLSARLSSVRSHQNSPEILYKLSQSTQSEELGCRARTVLSQNRLHLVFIRAHYRRHQRWVRWKALPPTWTSQSCRHTLHIGESNTYLFDQTNYRVYPLNENLWWRQNHSWFMLCSRHIYRFIVKSSNSSTGSVKPPRANKLWHTTPGYLMRQYAEGVCHLGQS